MFINSGLSELNYDALLIGWSKQTLQSDVSFSVGTIMFSPNEAEIAKEILTQSPNNWIITDGGINGESTLSSSVEISSSSETMSSSSEVSSSSETLISSSSEVSSSSETLISSSSEVSSSEVDLVALVDSPFSHPLKVLSINRISLSLQFKTESNTTRIQLMNVLGNLISSHSSQFTEGVHQVYWNRPLPPGNYFLTMEQDGIQSISQFQIQ